MINFDAGKLHFEFHGMKTLTSTVVKLHVVGLFTVVDFTLNFTVCVISLLVNFITVLPVNVKDNGKATVYCL